jgi:molecular chaperone GrpE
MKDEKNKNKEEIEEVEQESENNELEELQVKAEEFENNYKRALADYQNLQKRVNEEKSDWIKSANKDLLLRLLPVLDTLMLAEKHLQDSGLTVSINHFLDILKSEGVTRIKTVGEDFNPHLMECVTTEKGQENKVLEELRAGYMLYDKILRPAQVKVGKE